MITAITATGDRKESFALCQKWMLRQTLQPDQWIVIDDGFEPLNITPEMFYLNRKKQANEPEFTLLLNLKEALTLVRGDKIIFFEDDEYYNKDYIKIMSEKLDIYDLVGIGESKYYHLSGKYFQHPNQNNASLAQTGFNIPVLEPFLDLFNGNQYVDMRLWKSNQFKKHVFFDREKSLYCGMKGMTGRKGIGWAHNENDGRFKDDIDYEILKRWIPEDYKIYLEKIGSENKFIN